jgi:hypothetical protein
MKIHFGTKVSGFLSTYIAAGWCNGKASQHAQHLSYYRLYGLTIFGQFLGAVITGEHDTSRKCFVQMPYDLPSLTK